MLTALRAVRARGSPLPGLRRALLAFVMLVSIPLIAVDSPILTMAGALALTVYLVLSWRQFSFGSWVPVVLSVVALILALRRDIPSEVILRAADRMVFLATLIAMLGTLRSAAVFAPEVARAGIFLTNQPASRRYLALASGGHLFGVLINFGGLALLLDLAARSMSSQATRDLPPDVQEARRRRMTIATIRGFGLISLWSPFGFATNAILITLPGISYWQFGPLGFAMSFLFLGVGWAFDRWQGRRFRQQGLRPAQPPEGAWIGAAMLVGHVLLLGALVAVLQAAAPISFQQSLILVVPAYSLLWAALTGWQEARRPAQGIRRAADATWHRLAEMGPEVSVFAAAGFSAGDAAGDDPGGRIAGRDCGPWSGGAADGAWAGGCDRVAGLRGDQSDCLFLDPGGDRGATGHSGAWGDRDRAGDHWRLERCYWPVALSDNADHRRLGRGAADMGDRAGLERRLFADDPVHLAVAFVRVDADRHDRLAATASSPAIAPR